LQPKIKPAIALRGSYPLNAKYFESMRRPDVFVPAAIVISDYVNQYLEKSLSLEVSFDLKVCSLSHRFDMDRWAQQ
jgi:hypothetical protein